MSVDSRKGGVRTLKRIALNALRLTKLRADVSEHRVAMLRDKCAIELVQLPIHHARLCAVVGAALLMMAESISLLAPSRCLIDVLRGDVYLNFRGCQEDVGPRLRTSVSDNADLPRFSPGCGQPALGLQPVCAERHAPCRGPGCCAGLRS